MDITNIDILYYEPRDYMRARGQFFDIEELVHEHGQGHLNVHYPPLTDDYVDICHYDTWNQFVAAMSNAGIKIARPSNIDALDLNIIYDALNADIDRTKIVSCRSSISQRTGKRVGFRSMSINDVVCATVSGKRRCFIVKSVGFGELPDEWERSFDPSSPLSSDIVGQCQDQSEKDIGEFAWRKFIGTTFPWELMKQRTKHDSPWKKVDVAAMLDEALRMASLKGGKCIDDSDKKAIERYVRAMVKTVD